MLAHLDRLRAPLLRCARGELPANVALAQLFTQAHDAVEARLALAKAIRHCRRQANAAGLDRLLGVRDLWKETPGAFTTVSGALRAVEESCESGGKSPAHWACAFDRAAGLSSTAGVALYSLGRTDLLRAATDEIVRSMRAWNLLAPSYAALDLGCGNGRLTRALAGELRLVVGIDVSPAMLNAARRSCADLDNARFVLSSGYDLAVFCDAAFDLVCAVDSFPYLFMSGLAESQVLEAARVLKSCGKLLILNYSYRNDGAADRADIVRIAAAAGLMVRHNGPREFVFWDGCSFLLEKIA